MSKKKFKSFEEYVQANYYNVIENALKNYIEANELVLFSDEYGSKTYSDYKINNIRVCDIEFTKNHINCLEFTVHFSARYTISDDVYDPESKFPSVFDRKEHFLYKMGGSFEKGFFPKDDEEIEKDESDCKERLTSSLVPVISVQEMDLYATKFLKHFCPEALETPTRLLVETMLKNKGIKVFYAPLDDEIYGKTYFGNDKASIYDPTKFITQKIIDIEVEPGTILINRNKAWSSYDGVNRNTMVHEAVHWYFHRNYFELRKLLNPRNTHIVCCKGLNKYENDDIKWMEWQARTLAPHILMPKKQALVKFGEIADEIDGLASVEGMTVIQKWELMLKKFKSFFGVTAQSARIRLRELGATRMDGIGVYVDNKPIKSFTFKADYLKKNQTFVINKDELKTIRENNPWIDYGLKTKAFVYTNGLIVVNDDKYYSHKSITDYALNHADECCLVFDIHSLNQESKNAKTIKAYLKSTDGSSSKINKDPSIESGFNIFNSVYCGEKAFKKSFVDIATLDIFDLIAHYRKIHGDLSDAWLEDRVGVSARSLGKYARRESTPDKLSIVKIGLGLRLSQQEIYHMLHISQNISTDVTCLDTIFTNALIMNYAGRPNALVKAYNDLKKIGKEAELKLTSSFKKNNNIIENS